MMSETIREVDLNPKIIQDPVAPNEGFRYVIVDKDGHDIETSEEVFPTEEAATAAFWKRMQDEKNLVAQNATVWANHRPINAKTPLIALALVASWIIPLVLFCWLLPSSFIDTTLGILMVVATSLASPCILLLFPMHEYHLAALLETISVVQEDNQLWFFEIPADSTPVRSASAVAGLGPTVAGAAATVAGAAAYAADTVQCKENELHVGAVNEIMAFKPHKLFKVDRVESIRVNRDYTAMNVTLYIKEGKHSLRCKLLLKDTYNKSFSSLEAALRQLQTR